MLSSFLTAVQSALTSAAKGFLFASFLPVLSFVVANYALLKVLKISWATPYVARAETWANASLSQNVLASFALVVAVLLMAMILTALQPVLLRLLEGEGLPRALASELHRRQVSRRERLRRRVELARPAMTELADLLERVVTLQDLKTNGRRPAQATVDMLRELERQRCLGETILPASIENAEEALRADAEVPGRQPDALLTELKTELMRAAEYALDRATHTSYMAERALQTWFPGDVFEPTPSSDNVLAPTTLGNIARTMRTYALRRYSMDLDIFWTRLQKVMADNTSSKMFETLQAQKTQLDCIVALFFLAVLTGLLWVPALAATHTHGLAFSVLASATPCACWLLYHAACRTYLVFADQVRTAVDFFRFDVLTGYKLALPLGTREEERLWTRLGSRVAYANDSETFTYARQQQR
jgi:hypothetical protein